MVGRIHPDDIAEVLERARIDDIIGTYVTLKKAGGGSQKGLCPFHDEKTPSFQVTPSRGFFYCFGCGEGGDVITFLQKIDNLSFTEAVERLADKTGIQLRYTEDDPGVRAERGQRMRILEANAAAAEWFAAQLRGPEALQARQFLDQRGFDRAAAERFGVGYAPRGGRELGTYLRGKGFSEPDLQAAGLVRNKGWDFFNGRLLWPIRDSGSSVLGFGGRRLYDDDRLPAKYINTPETPVYKKSHVLYGLDLARQAIGKQSQAVVVEGYTDVMAAHLSGVETAVASCGTAFGDDHARVLQRLMGNHDSFHGEVIFTFDGDAAGQKAALKVFSGDKNFISQTYVAIEPTGLDPCDLRLQHGPAAVRELVARRIPLYRFVMGNVIAGFDLDRAEGRTAAMRAAAPLVSSIRDVSLVNGYARELAGMIGLDVEEVRREVGRAASRHTEPAPEPAEEHERPPELSLLPDPTDRALSVERGTCQLLVQQPELFSPSWEELQGSDFTHPAYAALFSAVKATDATGRGGEDWLVRLRTHLGEGPAAAALEHLIASLAVQPLLSTPDQKYVQAYAAKLRLLSTVRAIADLKSKLQRTNPVDQQTAYNQMFADLLVLENRRKDLQARSVGIDS
ncbi:DNA primase [Naumannella halotolerans]|uniref:DNA primase n=1 Tax=Naumannella halotolerans TaxID=993414 RepID=UPI00370DAE7B